MVRPGGCAFILKGSDSCIIKQHLSHIKNKVHSKDEGIPLVVLNCRGISDIEDSYNISEYIISLCRKYDLLENERCSLLSHMDQLIALQLSIAEKNKEDTGEFDVETSTVLTVNSAIINKKLSKQSDVPILDSIDGYDNYTQLLKSCNYVDTCDVLTTVQDGINGNEALQEEIRSTHFLFLGIPTNKVEEEMVRFLCGNKEVKQVILETPLDNEGEVTVTSKTSTFTEILTQVGDEDRLSQSPKAQLSMTESFVQLVFGSYLELLVNSRSELALARSLNVPERELTHTSFTDLKHESQKKKMTMYQTALSFVMRIRLGGKGYQPDPECALAQHVKGLGEYVGMIQRLQNIVEEEENVRLACKKVLNVIKKEIVKCQDSRLRVSSVESVCEKLKLLAVSVVSKQEKSDFKSPEKPARDGGTLLGRKTLRVIRHIVDKLVTETDLYKTQSLDYLCDGFSSQKTPVRFPCLLSQFRSPEEDPGVPEYNQSLIERLSGKIKSCQTPANAKRYKSNMDWAEPLHQVKIHNDDITPVKSSIFVLPSKTLVHPASGGKSALPIAKKIKESINDQENASVTSIHVDEDIHTDKEMAKSKAAPKGGKSKKRQMEKVEDSGPEKKKSKTQPKTTCRRKLLPQVKGQQQINRFFRV